MISRRCSILVVLLLIAASAGQAAVFQYRISVQDHKDRQKHVFLWIPPQARQVRGIVASGMTLMEREMSRDPVIRKTCRQQDLAILFSTAGIGGIDLQAVLKQFAEVSGYRELPVAPLLFAGHSAGGPPAGRLAARYADRCFGVVQYRGGGPGNVDLPGGVPSLMMVGQFDEFGGTMRRQSGRETWESGREHVAAYRATAANALASLVVEPGRGHFAWSDKNAAYLAMWIAKAAEARIPPAWPIDADKPVSCRPIDPADGWLTDLDGIENAAKAQAAAYKQYQGDKNRAAWHFDKAMAQAWIAYHAGGFGKKDQFLQWNDRYWVDAGTRYFFLGMKWVDDGQTFVVHPVYADKYPGQPGGRGPKWLKAGEPAGHAETPIRVKPVSGPIVRVGKHKFRMKYDTLTPAFGRQRVTFMAYSEGDETYRYTERVGMMPRGFRGLKKGKAQTITFPEIPDLPADTASYELQATSDADLPVEYYVAFGPAKIVDGKLTITQIPPRAKLPIEVEVVAWQFGRGVEPKVKTAEPVARSFQITKP